MKNTNYKILIFVTAIGILGGVATTSAQSLGCGGWHSLGICSDSTVKAFGENATGQIGNGNTIDQATPVTVAGLSGIIAVSGGGDQLEAHSMALKANGTVWCWGSNLYGGLGNASAMGTFVTAPVQALILTGAKAISAGGWHSVALKNDGTVWAWGWNGDGQLGDGTTVDKSIPTQVPSLTNVTKIAAGTYHTLALKNDGTVWAWGDNVSGQLGNGTTGSDRNTPVQVNGLANVVAITAGRFFSMAVKNDGSVWTWGQNLYGQLGNGNTTDSNVPVQVNGLTDITSAVAASGAFHAHALKNDGTVWSWGRNTYGNLGNNTLINSSVPVLMTNFTSPMGMAAGTNFSLFYKSDGSMWGIGRNASGQLGNATVTQRNVAFQSPVMCSVLQPQSIIGINETNLTKVKVAIFPNPSTGGAFNLELVNATISNYKIEVYNGIGQNLSPVLLEPIANNKMRINLTTKPDGIYYLQLKASNHTLYHKIVKQ